MTLAVRNKVVIFSKPEDLHALAVANELEKLGGEPILLDTADYPNSWHISTDISDEDFGYRIVLGDRTISGCEVAGAWWRRPRPFKISDEITDSRYIKFCRAEAGANLEGLLLNLGRRVINPLDAEYAANQKPFQLAAARAAGLSIPKTLITSNPDHVLEFQSRLSRPVIFKVLTNAPWQMVETRVLEASHVEQFDAIRFAPLIFQERVPKIADVRVTIIDDRVFAVQCVAQNPGAALDWRLDASVTYPRYELPADIAANLIKLHRDLNLRFGAVDLCVTKDGEYVFLETNTAGQFFFAEIHGGHPLAGAMAQALLQPDLSTRPSQGATHPRRLARSCAAE